MRRASVCAVASGSEFVTQPMRRRNAGSDPNDRHYSRELQLKIKWMDPQELDALLRDDDT